MASHKFDSVKFNGSNDFTIWKLNIKALLNQQGCVTTLEGEAKLTNDMEAVKNVDILERANNTILLSLIDKVLRKVMDQKSVVGIWKKLCDKYQNNPLTNSLYQKQHFYTIMMSESTEMGDHRITSIMSYSI